MCGSPAPESRTPSWRRGSGLPAAWGRTALIGRCIPGGRMRWRTATGRTRPRIPRIRDGDIVQWRADMAIIAAHPQVVCKLSGLVTEAQVNTGLETLRPYIAALLELFGPQRLLWGSDWPFAATPPTCE